MENKLFLTVLTVLSSAVLCAQSDTGNNKSFDTLKKTVARIEVKVDTIYRKGTFVSECYDCKNGPTTSQMAIILLPVILFVLASVYVVLRLNKRDYFISDALAEKNAPLLKKEDKPDEPPRSTSRIIAFFSGMATVIIAVCAVSFFFYMYFRTGIVPDFDKLFNILMALGFGVTPYAFNKLAEAIKK